MGHINEFEEELRARIGKGFTNEDVKWVKETVLQSYRNGVEMGAKVDKRDVRNATRFAKRAQKNAGR